MSETLERERDQLADGVLLIAAFDDREDALVWGNQGYENDMVQQPFSPIETGETDIGYCPGVDGDLILLNEEKGKLPENADLEYGVTLGKNVYFRGLKLFANGRFGAMVSADEVAFAAKVTEAEPELAAEADAEDTEATEAGAEEAPAGEADPDVPASTEEAAADPDVPDAGTAGDEPLPPENQAQGE